MHTLWISILNAFTRCVLSKYAFTFLPCSDGHHYDCCKSVIVDQNSNCFVEAFLRRKLCIYEVRPFYIEYLRYVCARQQRCRFIEGKVSARIESLGPQILVCMLIKFNNSHSAIFGKIPPFLYSENDGISAMVHIPLTIIWCHARLRCVKFQRGAIHEFR